MEPHYLVVHEYNAGIYLRQPLLHPGDAQEYEEQQMAHPHHREVPHVCASPPAAMLACLWNGPWPAKEKDRHRKYGWR
eukprot:1152494-Pelagomonas_calceolata.AAC.4